MSYYKAKNININQKKETITMTVASSNLHPLSFFTSEYAETKTFEEKLRSLYEDIWDGNIHPYPSCSKGKIYYSFLKINTALSNLYNISIPGTWSLSKDDQLKVKDYFYPLWKKAILSL